LWRHPYSHPFQSIFSNFARILVFRRAQRAQVIFLELIFIILEFLSAMDGDADIRVELKRDFKEFLEQDFGRETGENKYARKINDLIKHYEQTKRLRLEVDLQGERWLHDVITVAFAAAAWSLLADNETLA
jgi:hypothetical protein